MAVNWKSYASGDESEFLRVSSELIEFGHMDLRGRILRNWIPFIQGRTSILQKNLDKLLNGTKLGDLPAIPNFHFLATSLTNGSLCSFSKQDWIGVSLARHGPSFITDAKSLPLSRVVAASAAFPPLFPPVKFKMKGLGKEQEDSVPATHYLTDGGIFDNLGIAHIRTILDRLGEGPRYTDRTIVKDGFSQDPFGPESLIPGCVLMSDASAVFDHKNHSKFQSIISRTIRSSDIMMARLAARDRLVDSLYREQDEAGSRIDQENGIKHISIKNEIDSFQWDSGEMYRTQSPSIQKYTKFVRTDLDRFDGLVMKYLVNHGHEVAADTIHRMDPKVVFRAFQAKLDFPEDSMEDPERLEKYMDTQRSRFRKSNLCGAVNIPIRLIAILAVLAVAYIYFS